MKRSRFSEEQIIGILKEHQAGLGAKELCRKHGISDATFYKWRSKYSGMEVSDARRLKTLESENAKLKKMLAEQMMDVATLKSKEKCMNSISRIADISTIGIWSIPALTRSSANGFYRIQKRKNGFLSCPRAKYYGSNGWQC